MTEQESLQHLIGHWRWASMEGRGGADAYIRVRDAAQRDAYGRAADEAVRAGQPPQSEAVSAALSALVVSLRERSQSGWLPEAVALPQWPSHRPAPTLDAARVRREQQIGYSIALADCASQLGELNGEES